MGVVDLPEHQADTNWQVSCMTGGVCLGAVIGFLICMSHHGHIAPLRRYPHICNAE